MRHHRLLAVLAAASLSVPSLAVSTLAYGQAAAPAWPTRPVTLVHPLTSGGPGDREFRPYLDLVSYCVARDNL